MLQIPELFPPELPRSYRKHKSHADLLLNTASYLSSSYFNQNLVCLHFEKAEAFGLVLGISFGFFLVRGCFVVDDFIWIVCEVYCFVGFFLFVLFSCFFVCLFVLCCFVLFWLFGE